MESYVLDWLSLLARWAHVVAGIAWVGASFYFIWLEDRLDPPQDARLAGELPATPRSFKWEAYWTWISGFVLLVLVYYANAEVYLIDAAVMPLSKWAAIGIGLASLVVPLAVYEGLCRARLDERLLALLVFLLLAASAWVLTRVFGGRGAFLHYGAVLGTIMAGNVAHVIVPGERRTLQALREGRAPDPKDAAMARQRSVHNSYLALPVVFAMISNHHAMTFGSRWGWLALSGMTLAGALPRAWFAMRHKGRASHWVWIAGAAIIAVLAVLLAPESKTAGPPAQLADVQKVIAARCLACHASQPSFPGVAEAPKAVLLDTPQRIAAQRAQILQQVQARAMPPGNLTHLTDAERELLERWARAR